MANFRIDRAGVRAMLQSSEVATVLNGIGNSVASSIDAATSDGVPVEVKDSPYVTDRAAVGVTLAHPAGLRIEAKHGTLVRAASAQGLEVTGR